MTTKTRWHWLTAAFVLLCGCTAKPTDKPEGSSAATPGSSNSNAAAPSPAPLNARGISGQQMVRAGTQLLIADEQHGAFRFVQLPVSEKAKATSVAVDGPLAQVAAFGDRAWATQRNPGALIEFARTDAGAWTKVRSLPLAADAWGIALQGDGKVAYVTSAWTHRLTRVDLKTWQATWEANLAREPRGIAVTKDGKRLYVSHLTDYRVTQVDDLAKKTPVVTQIEAATAPSLTLPGAESAGTLGYSLALYDDDKRLALPRRALSAIAGADWGADAWAGVGTVDVMLTAEKRVIGEPRKLGVMRHPTSPRLAVVGIFDRNAPVPVMGTRLSDIRSVVYRKATQTFLVADQAKDALVELDAHSVATGLDALSVYKTGSNPDDFRRVSREGVAPSAIALSEDAATAYVYCHVTNDVLAIKLDDHPTCDAGCDTKSEDTGQSHPKTWPRLRLAEDALITQAAAAKTSAKRAKETATGRAIYYDSGKGRGMACSSCHPEGRDDGHTWHEMHNAKGHGGTNFATAPDSGAIFFTSHHGLAGSGRARQTPMLVNRSFAAGPYGWRGESQSLPDRIKAGFDLHAWNARSDWQQAVTVQSASLVALFLRSRGLVQPPEPPTKLSEQQKRGKTLFMSEKVGCSSCHDPAHGYTDRNNAEILIPTRTNFVREPGAFRTPSLKYVGASAPYYHNGSVSTLAKLVAGMGDRMGKTSHLTDEDRAALVTFLETL